MNHLDELANSPLILPGTRDIAADMEVPEMRLDKVTGEVDREAKKTS